jgi:hypothetical protein
LGVVLTISDSGLVFFFLAGALAPIGGYLMGKKFPNSVFKYINFPVIFNGTAAIPPANAVVSKQLAVYRLLLTVPAELRQLHHQT